MDSSGMFIGSFVQLYITITFTQDFVWLLTKMRFMANLLSAPHNVSTWCLNLEGVQFVPNIGIPFMPCCIGLNNHHLSQ